MLCVLVASWYTAWDAPNVHFYFLMLHICGFLCCLDMVLNDSFKEITRFIYMRKVMICILTGDGRIVHLWAVCQLVKLAQRWHCTVVFDSVSPGFVSRLQQLLFIPSLSLSLSPLALLRSRVTKVSPEWNHAFPSFAFISDGHSRSSPGHYSPLGHGDEMMKSLQFFSFFFFSAGTL